MKNPGRMATSIRYSARILFVLACATSGIAACSAAFEPAAGTAARYQVSSSRPSAQVTARSEGDKAIIEIYSENGIGDATVNLVSGDWPAKIVMRFHLQGLEGMQFTYDETQVILSVTTQNMILQSVSQDGGASEPTEDGSAYWMPVSFFDKEGAAVDRPAAGGVIEVIAPADFHAGDHAAFTINWIDFYR
jgi:hypothetical protein